MTRSWTSLKAWVRQWKSERKGKQRYGISLLFKTSIMMVIIEIELQSNFLARSREGKLKWLTSYLATIFLKQFLKTFNKNYFWYFIEQNVYLITWNIFNPFFIFKYVLKITFIYNDFFLIILHIYIIIF